jgi:hypothetical protein
MTDSPYPRERSIEPHQGRVDKPWGWEVLWAETPWYVGKLLHVRAGQRLSLQYHDDKLETQCLIDGQAKLIIEDASGTMQEVMMVPQRGYTIVPFQRHRVMAVTDADIVEVSTPERGTTFRLEDDYTRPDETETVRREDRGQ